MHLKTLNKVFDVYRKMRKLTIYQCNSCHSLEIKVQVQFLVLLHVDFTFYQHFLSKTYLYFILFLRNPSSVSTDNLPAKTVSCCCTAAPGAWRLGGKSEILGNRKKLILLICTYILLHT